MPSMLIQLIHFCVWPFALLTLICRTFSGLFSLEYDLCTCAALLMVRFRSVHKQVCKNVNVSGVNDFRAILSHLRKIGCFMSFQFYFPGNLFFIVLYSKFGLFSLVRLLHFILICFNSEYNFMHRIILLIFAF